MRRIIVTASLLAVLLMGCEQKENEQVVEPAAEEMPVWETLKLAEENFRFVAGWTDDSTIAFVEHQQQKDRLQTYNIHTREIHTIFEHTSSISEVLIHPSSKQLLVKTTDEPTEAELLFMDEEGTVSNTLTVESSEMEIQWNGSASAKLLVSAFQEDWSAQVLLFDTDNQTVETIDLPNPFPQWINEKDMVYIDDTDSLWKESTDSDDVELLAENVRQFKASEGRLMAEVMDVDEVSYQLFDEEGEMQSSWESTDVTGDLEDLEVKEDNIIMSTVNDDEADGHSTTNLYVMNGQEVTEYEVEAEGATISCSPDSSLCLVGYSLDTLVNMDTGEADKWLELGEQADQPE